MTYSPDIIAAPWGADAQSVQFLAERENRIYTAMGPRGKCVIRLHRIDYRSKDQIDAELQMMQAAALAGCAVPRAIPTQSGELVTQLGDHFATAIGWVDGNTLSVAELGAQDDAKIMQYFHALGSELGGLHDAYDAWRPEPGFMRDAWDAQGVLGATPLWGRFWENTDLTDQEQNLMLVLRQSLMVDLSNLGSDIDYGLIHADAVADNVIYDGRRTTLIDFDDAGYGYRLFDLATALIKWTDHRKFAIAAAALFAGYRTRRDLDEQHMVMMLTLRALTYVGWIITRRDLPDAATRSRRFINTALSLGGIYMAQSQRSA